MSDDTLQMDLRVAHGDAFSLEACVSIPLSGITAITGPSGSGKTTLLRALAGLDPCERSKIRFGSTVWDEGTVHLRPEARRIGFVFQDTSLFPHLSVSDNIRYGARRRGVVNYDAIIEALDLQSLLAREIRNLSGGEARRVAMARALASDPDILFLDEPLSGLDQARKEEFLPYIGRAVAEARVPALYVTHSRAEIAALADRVLGIAEGQVTGWLSPPVRLKARIVGVRGRTASAILLGAPENHAAAIVTISRIAEPGEIVGLGIRRESLLVSAAAPGRSDAVLQVPGRVVENEGGLVVDVFGQRLVLPSVGLHALGAEIWLSSMELSPRPEQSDSAENRR